ncbi:MAG: hypothetical protein V3R60_05330 [Acidobacteriota bacterium]
MKRWGFLAEAFPRFYLLRSLGLLALMLMVSMAAAGNLKGQSGEGKAPAAILNGTLVHAEDGSPVLVEGQRRYRIKATQEHLAVTLRDEHLRGRKMRLEGRLNGEGMFEVVKLFTVRDGQLYKVRYYCEICAITAVQPGPCACCQGPTEFQEIPATRENDWR